MHYADSSAACAPFSPSFHIAAVAGLSATAVGAAPACFLHADLQLQAILSAGDVDGDGRVTLQVRVVMFRVLQDCEKAINEY